MPNYDTWKTTPPDDDPYGEASQTCPGCAARNGERCEPDCTCGACERDEDDEAEDRSAA